MTNCVKVGNKVYKIEIQQFYASTWRCSPNSFLLLHPNPRRILESNVYVACGEWRLLLEKRNVLCSLPCDPKRKGERTMWFL